MPLRYRRLFTLFEVMITLMLIITVSSCFVPLGFKAYRYEKAKQVRNTFHQELRLIKELSLSYGEKFIVHVTQKDYWFETKGYLPHLKGFLTKKRVLSPLVGQSYCDQVEPDTEVVSLLFDD